MVVTLGAAGSLLLRQDGTSVVAPPFGVQAVDTIAAGDSFVGAFAVALASGALVEQALRWGNAAGALTATRAGAQPALPNARELDELLSSYA